MAAHLALDKLPQRLEHFLGDERIHLLYRRSFEVAGLCCRVKSNIFEKWGWTGSKDFYAGMVKRWNPTMFF